MPSPPAHHRMARSTGRPGPSCARADSSSAGADCSASATRGTPRSSAVTLLAFTAGVHAVRTALSGSRCTEAPTRRCVGALGVAATTSLLRVGRGSSLGERRDRGALVDRRRCSRLVVHSNWMARPGGIGVAGAGRAVAELRDALLAGAQERRISPVSNQRPETSSTVDQRQHRCMAAAAGACACHAVEGVDNRMSLSNRLERRCTERNARKFHAFLVRPTLPRCARSKGGCFVNIETPGGGGMRPFLLVCRPLRSLEPARLPRSACDRRGRWRSVGGASARCGRLGRSGDRRAWWRRRRAPSATTRQASAGAPAGRRRAADGERHLGEPQVVAPVHQ